MVSIVKLAIEDEKRRSDGYTPFELVDAIGRLAVNDVNKSKVGHVVQ